MTNGSVSRQVLYQEIVSMRAEISSLRSEFHSFVQHEAEFRGRTDQRLTDHSADIKTLEDNVHDLEGSDRKWAGVTGLVTGVFTFIASWLAIPRR